MCRNCSAAVGLAAATPRLLKFDQYTARWKKPGSMKKHQHNLSFPTTTVIIALDHQPHVKCIFYPKVELAH